MINFNILFIHSKLDILTKSEEPKHVCVNLVSEFWTNQKWIIAIAATTMR